MDADSAARKPDFTVVIPAHNEEDNLPTLLGELAAIRRESGIDLRAIIVDDGSTDTTREVIRQLAAEFHWVKGLVLTRNFGHQAAITIGLRHARGSYIGVMDADLQDRPGDLLELYRCAVRNNADVVYAVRRTRREGIIKRVCYRTFYRTLARISKVPIPVDSGDFCVMHCRFVDQLNSLPERLRFVRGLRAWIGGKQIALPVDRAERRSGKPSYDMARLFRLAGDGLVTFSDTPLRIASITGFFVAVLSFLAAIVVLVWKILGLLPRGAGVATIALAVLFLGGIQLISIGILGEYIGRIFDEVKSRPVAFIAEEISSSQ